MTLVSPFRQGLPVPLQSVCIPVLSGPPAPSFTMTTPGSAPGMFGHNPAFANLPLLQR